MWYFRMIKACWSDSVSEMKLDHQSNRSVLSVPLKVTSYGPTIWWPSLDCEAPASASWPSLKRAWNMIRTSRCAWRATRCSTWSRRFLWASAGSGTPAWTPTRFCQNPPSTSTMSCMPSAQACRWWNAPRLKPFPDQTRPVHVRQDHHRQMWAWHENCGKKSQFCPSPQALIFFFLLYSTCLF